MERDEAIIRSVHAAGPSKVDNLLKDASMYDTKGKKTTPSNGINRGEKIASEHRKYRSLVLKTRAVGHANAMTYSY